MSVHLPYGIIYVVAKLREGFQAAGCPCPIHYGEEHAGDHDPAPRITIFPSKKIPDRYKGPTAVQARGALGPRESIAGVQTLGGQNPRSVRVRVAAYEAHIWGRAPEQSDPEKQRVQDQLYLDALINQFCYHLYTVAPGNDQMSSGAANDPSKSMRHGLLYVVQFTVEVPIVDVDWQPGTIDERSLTWPLVSGWHADITENALDPAVDPENPDTETVMNTVTFRTPP